MYFCQQLEEEGCLYACAEMLLTDMGFNYTQEDIARLVNNSTHSTEVAKLLAEITQYNWKSFIVSNFDSLSYTEKFKLAKNYLADNIQIFLLTTELGCNHAVILDYMDKHSTSLRDPAYSFPNRLMMTKEIYNKVDWLLRRNSRLIAQIKIKE